MWLNPQETADLVTFTEEILNGKLHFLCSVNCIAKPISLISESYIRRVTINEPLNENERNKKRSLSKVPKLDVQFSQQ